MVYNVILVIHVVIAASVVALVLLQQGKGADVSGAPLDDAKGHGGLPLGVDSAPC